MSRDIDELMAEINRTEKELSEVSHQLEINREWSDILHKALMLACERITVAADPNFFDKDEDARKEAIRSMMVCYALRAQEGEYEPRHK